MSLKLVEKFYEGFEKADVELMLSALHPDFVLRVSEGMPLGVGGVHHGPQAAFRDCWGIIFTAYDTRPVPEEYLWADAGRCVVFGHYRGTARAGGQAFDAAFTHALTLREGRIAELVQITDTASWAPPGS